LWASGIRSADLVVLERGDVNSRPLGRAVIDQLRPGLVLAPADHVIIGAHALDRVATVEVSGGRLRIEPDGRRLRVRSE
jgi:hypothetical protein